eukprot:TRINITY_DN4432_c0_g2_i1.p1 TRINITY_DN4432_c0_g2~~TRINITY_DN4432_c0_g2_i1.p1  ORF type:complete len:494 (+),score=123.01 TRINITY_DN4432_c0_g2_i1:268-1749(+)
MAFVASSHAKHNAPPSAAQARGQTSMVYASSHPNNTVRYSSNSQMRTSVAPNHAVYTSMQYSNMSHHGGPPAPKMSKVYSSATFSRQLPMTFGSKLMPTSTSTSSSTASTMASSRPSTYLPRPVSTATTIPNSMASMGTRNPKNHLFAPSNAAPVPVLTNMPRAMRRGSHHINARNSPSFSLASKQPAMAQQQQRDMASPRSANGTKRGPYRCSRCGQMLKGHTCPFKDYNPAPRTPSKAAMRHKRASTSDVDTGSQQEALQSRQRRPRSASGLDSTDKHKAALQLMSIGKSQAPAANTGDAMARFMARLTSEHSIPHTQLMELFDSCLQASLDDPPMGKAVASVFTLSLVRNLIYLQSLGVIDDDEHINSVVRALSVSDNRVHLHYGGNAASKSASEASDDDAATHQLRQDEVARKHGQKSKAEEHMSAAFDAMLAAASVSESSTVADSNDSMPSSASDTSERSGTATSEEPAAWMTAVDAAINAKSLKVTP